MHMHADFTSTSELLFVSLERVIVLNISHENGSIFMQINVQVTYIFIPIALHKDSFCYRGKSKLKTGLFIHELLREPLIAIHRLNSSTIDERGRWCLKVGGAGPS